MSTNIVPLRTGGQVAAIVPTSIEEVFRLAKAISVSGLAPQGMKQPEQITVALLHGMELGLPPMQALQNIAVINGKPTLYGNGIPALLYARNFKIKEWVEGDTAYCTVTRPDGAQITRSFSKKDAETAGLWGKSGPWKQFPERMLKMRARGYAARDGAADVLSGMYLAEEIDGGELVDATPKAPQPAQQAISEIPDLPDDEPAEDPPIADPAKLIAEMQADMAMAKASGADVSEVQQSYEHLIARLPEDFQADAYAALELEPPQ